MIDIKQTIENAIYTYDTDEFQPIFREGRLDNKGEYALYKVEQFAESLGHLASRTLHVAGNVGSTILEHVAMEVE